MSKPTAIEELIFTLKRRLTEVRKYRVRPDGCFAVPDTEYEMFQESDPQPTRIAPKENPSGTRVEMADIAIMGCGKQSKLAKKWGVNLPPDYLAFCSVFREYVLAGRNPIHILDLQFIEETAIGLRKSWNYPLSHPHRIVHFAEIVGVSGYFLFRWKPGVQLPEVLLLEDTALFSEPELLGPDGDSLVADASFSAWLVRMIETDGYPLMPGRTEPEFDALERVK